MSLEEFPSEEYHLLNGLEKFFNFSPSDRFPVGAGDDAAVRHCDKDEQLVLTGDSLVENVHFSLTYMNLEEVGYKAMVANISDCAAMGTTVDSAIIQVVFPVSYDLKQVESTLKELYTGVKRACVKWDFPVVGGDISKGQCWMIAVSLTGRKNSGGRILRRTGAVVGDDLWVTGIPGRSAAALNALNKWGREQVPEEYHELVESHVAPCARVDTGLKLAGDSSVHAAIDLSDGISKECYTLCYDNKVGISLSPKEDCLPESVNKLSDLFNKPWYEWFLYGGEDYELLFTASESFNTSKYNDITLYKIGKITDNINTVVFKDFTGNLIIVEKRAWDHLKSNSNRSDSL